jgi:hypothetical protein
MKLPPVIARHARQFGTFAVFVVLCAIISVLTPHFFTVTNLLNVAQQTVINALIAVGLTYVIISGGIDLSVGSILAFSGVVMAHTLRLGWPLPLAILAGVGVGARLRPGQRSAHRLRSPAALHRHAGHDERGARRRSACHRRPPGVGLRRILPLAGHG